MHWNIVLRLNPKYNKRVTRKIVYNYYLNGIRM